MYTNLNKVELPSSIAFSMERSLSRRRDHAVTTTYATMFYTLRPHAKCAHDTVSAHPHSQQTHTYVTLIHR